ncbi:MAG: hypothetical protein AAF830_15155 [Pseudomonadota bacterium]
MKKSLLIAAALAAASPGAAHAVISTTCASPTSCSFTEFDGGATLTAAGITMSLSAIEDFSDPMLDLSSLVVTASTEETGVLFSFDFASPVVISSLDSFVSLDFDIDVSTDGDPLIEGLELTSDGLDSMGDAGSSVAMDVGGMGMTFLDVFDDFFAGEMFADATAVTPTTDLSVLAAIMVGTFEDGAMASISGFDLLVVADIPAGPPVPVPPAALLMAAGLGLAARRRKSS